MSNFLNISQIKSVFKTMGEKLKVSHTVFCVEETSAIKRMKEKNGVCLLVCYPSFVRVGGQDNFSGKNALMIWVLEKGKVNSGTGTDDDDDAQMSTLQYTVTDVLNYMDEQCSKGCTVFSAMMPEFTQVNPEYNQFGGYNGWQIEIIL